MDAAHYNKRRKNAFTIIEVLVSLLIVGIGLSGTVSAYILSARNSEWVLCESSAQNLALQRLQQARAAKWDHRISPVIDELVTSNFPALVRKLEIPQTGTNSLTARITTAITDISSSPPMRRIQVDAVWNYWDRGPFTSSVSIVRSPDLQ